MGGRCKSWIRKNDQVGRVVCHTYLIESVTHGLVTNKKPNLVFLIETKLRKEEWEFIKKKIKMPNNLVVESRGHKGGLALLWPRTLSVDVKSYSTHHIEVIIQDKNSSPWRFVGFYGDHETAKRKISWNLMRNGKRAG
ncbi:hypothetical protein LIER_19193 [Lithospermum erythrorhizon]|uniref:Uncharacterized protein n=1 Tax=Lithospermum erythrorhizon TaxID=34254 RepID=A0AAV3QGS7_LITER